MGLFSSKKTITVSARTMNLVGISDHPFTQAVLSADVQSKDMTAALLQMMHGSPAANIHRLHTYARDVYTLGLPQGQALNYSGLDLDDVDAALLIEKGNTPLLLTDGTTYVPITPAISVYPYLYDVRKYNYITNLVGVHPPGIVWQPRVGLGALNVATANKQVRLKSASVGLDEVSIDVVYGLFLEQPVVLQGGSGGGEDGYYQYIEYQYIEESYTYTENIPLPGASTIVWGEEYLVAIYREYDVTGVTTSGSKVWLYQVSSNTYPNLSYVASSIDSLDYFPVIPLRYKNQDYMSDPYKGTALYNTSKRLAKIADMDLDVLASKLNANPSIGDIDHAYTMYGINLRTEVKASLLYLHKFFEQLYNTQYSNKLDYLEKIGTVANYGASPVNSYLQAVPGGSSTFEEYGLRIFLDYDYITSEIGPGVVGDGRIGQITKTLVEYDDQIITTTSYTDGFIGDYTEDTVEIVPKGAMLLKLQVAPNVVQTIGVYGLEHRNMIYKGRSEHTSMLDVIRDPDENNLVIPLQYQLTMSMDFRTRMDVYSDAMVMVINTYQVVKGKWYTAGWFKIIMIIVAVIIIVLAVMSGQVWLAALVAEGMTTLMALGYMAAVYILTSVVVSLAAKYIVKEFGAELGIVGTMVLLAVAAAATGGASLGGSSEAFLMMTAQVCLQAGAALVSASNEFMMEAAQDVVNEYQAFTSKLEDRYKELKTAEDLLANASDISPLTFTQPARLKIVPNETPDQFYSRCLQLPAYTMTTIHDQLPGYCTRLLQLPKAMSANQYARA